MSKSNVPAVVVKRINAVMPKFKRVLKSALKKDVNESDTVTIVSDMLSEVFGFDKYEEITREYAISGTFCDLAIELNDKVEYLIEVKAVGIKLNSRHVKQAVDYAARSGISWVILTNGISWNVHRVTLNGCVNDELVYSFDVTTINHKNAEELEMLYMLCKRGVQKSNLDSFYTYKKSVNSYSVGAVLQSEAVINTIRREMKKVNSMVNVSTDDIAKILLGDIIRRDILENDEGKKALRKVKRVLSNKKKKVTTSSPAPAAPMVAAPVSTSTALVVV